MNSSDESDSRRPRFRLTPRRQAELAEYLALSRAKPAPLAEYAGKPLPAGALMAARRLGMFGVTEADVRRLVDEMAARIPVARKTGPPSLTEVRDRGR